MAVDDTSDSVCRSSGEEDVDSSDRERQERLVYVFAELEGVFELIEAQGDTHSDAARSLAEEVEAVRERLTYEPDSVTEAELRALVRRIVDELGIDFEPLAAESD